MDNPVKKKKDLTPDEIKYGGIVTSNSGSNIPEQESALETFIQTNVHEVINHPEDLKIPFLELNEQIAAYTRENRQSKDVVVATQLACIATGREIKHKEPIVLQTSNPIDIVKLFEY